MAYKVARAFKCKLTGARFGPGGTYETSDPERAAVLMEKGFLKKQKIAKQEPAQEPEPEEVEEVEAATEETPEEYPKHVGGGYWETPDGQRYKGKDAALGAMGGE